MRLLRGVNRTLGHVSAAALLLLTVVILSQILYRYVLRQPLVSADEIARFSMVWMVMLGSTVVVRNRGHIAVGFFVQLTPLRVQKFFGLLTLGIQIVFFGLLTIYGIQLTIGAMAQKSTALQIPMGWIMASIPISAAISLLHVGQQFVETWVNPPRPEVEAVRQEPLA